MSRRNRRNRLARNIPRTEASPPKPSNSTAITVSNIPSTEASPLDPSNNQAVTITTSESKPPCCCLKCSTEADEKNPDEESSVSDYILACRLRRLIAPQLPQTQGPTPRLPLAQGDICFTEAGSKKTYQPLASNYLAVSHMPKTTPQARGSFTGAGIKRNAELSTKTHSMAFYRQNYMAQPSTSYIPVYPPPPVSELYAKDYTIPESFTSFLRSENSFLCPWAWDGGASASASASASATPRSEKPYVFEPGSFFEHQWDAYAPRKPADGDKSA